MKKSMRLKRGLKKLSAAQKKVEDRNLVELYIDRDKESGDGNKVIFDTLMEHREEIEKEFGEPLLWEPLELKRACRISKTVEIGGYKDEDKWSIVHEAMIETMMRFERALRSHIDELKLKLKD